MALLRINATPNGLAADGAEASGPAAAHAIRQALACVGPVIVLIHGYKFAPGEPGRSPHRHILSAEPVRGHWKAVSWPRHLGFGRGDTREGLCIAFGWDARGSLAQAYRRAGTAGAALARLVAEIAAEAPGRQVHVVAHSLGARVALTALRQAPAGAFGRLVLLAAAEFSSEAQAALAAPGAASAEIVNVTSRENDLFDFLFERLAPAPRPGDRALGLGLGPLARCRAMRPPASAQATHAGSMRWLDIQLDHPGTAPALRGLGFRLAPAERRVCHWSPYLRPGALAFYRALLREPERLPLPLLRGMLPAAHAPRWSRLLAPPRLRPPLSSVPHVPS